jgi:hypothetical protein
VKCTLVYALNLEFDVHCVCFKMIFKFLKGQDEDAI